LPRYNVLTASNTVEISFRVVSNKTRSMREFTTVVAFDALKNAQFTRTLRGPLMADTVVRDQMVNFVKIEALKPGSNEYYDPVVAGNV
jgi:hypothetical protein